MKNKITKNNKKRGFTQTLSVIKQKIFWFLNIPLKVKKANLVSGFARTLSNMKEKFSKLFFKKRSIRQANLVSGFTIVETLVAISILSISITATFTAVQNGLRSSLVAKDQTTAFYLAQEAVEYIKNIRDENALYNIKQAIDNNTGGEKNWLDGIAGSALDPCYFIGEKVCIIDSPAKTVTSCGSAPVTNSPPNICDNMTQNVNSYLYGHSSTDGWLPTNFKREIQIEEVVANKEVRVVVSVSWTGSAGPRFFQITETLLNRQ